MNSYAHPKNIAFSINRYDSSGDVLELGVFLHFGQTIVKAAETVSDFKAITAHMAVMVNEIEENYEAVQ